MNPQGSFCIDPQNNLDVSVCILLTQDFLKKTQSGLTARSNELGRRSCTLHPDILRICQVEFASTCLRRLFSFFFRSLWFLLKRLLCQNMLIPLHSHWHTVVFIDCFMKELAETLTFNLNCQLAMCFFFSSVTAKKVDWSTSEKPCAVKWSLPYVVLVVGLFLFFYISTIITKLSETKATKCLFV